MSNPATLIPGAKHRVYDGKSCPACIGTGRLHSCEDFPLPHWTHGYLARFDAYKPLTHGQLSDDFLSDLADSINALDSEEA